MPFQSKLLERRVAAAGVTLTKIYDVYMKPDGRVEGDGESIAETLERGNEVLRRDVVPDDLVETLGLGSQSVRLVFSRFFDWF